MAKRNVYRLEYSVDRHVDAEDLPILGNAMASGDPAFDREVAEDIERQLEAGNYAAWCVAMLHVHFEFYRNDLLIASWLGQNALGGCSYESEQALWKDMEESFSFTENATEEALNGVLVSISRANRGAPNTEPSLTASQRAALAVELARWLEQHPNWAVWVDQWYLKNA